MAILARTKLISTKKMLEKEFKKKFLYIINTDKFLLSHRIEIAKELLKNNYEVHLGSAQTEASYEIKKLGIKAHALNINRSKTDILDLILTGISIYRLIKKVKPEFVHFISIKPVLIGCIVSKFFRNKPKLIVSISGLGFIFVDQGLLAKLRRFFIIILYKISLSNRELSIIFQNEADKLFISKICNLSKDQSFLIKGSGVNLEKFKPSDFKLDNKIVLLPTRIVKSKGILEFIKAATILRGKSRFVICGDFDSEAKDKISQEYINQYVKKNIIEYWGFKENMSDIYQSSTIVVLPSYREGLPKALCEAGACGKPIITTKVPGCMDAIINNKTGILVPPRNSRSLAKAIEKLLNDKNLCQSMGIKGRLNAEKNFNIKKVVESHLIIYEEIK